MKKNILIIIILCFIALHNIKSDYVDINQLTIVSSIGMDYQDGEVIIKIYIMNNFSLSKSELSSSNDISGYCYTKKGKDVYEAIENFNTSCNVVVDYEHLASLVMTKNFISSSGFDSFFTFIKEAPRFSKCFNIFITDEALDDIYLINSSPDLSSFYNLLCESKKEDMYRLTNLSILLTDYYDEKFFAIYPSIKTSKEKNGSEKNNLSINGYYYLTKKEIDQIKLTSEGKGSLYISNFISINDNPYIPFIFNKAYNVYLEKEKLKVITYSKNILRLNYYFIFYKIEINALNNESKVKNNFYQGFKDDFLSYIKECYDKDIDYFNINYYGYTLSDIKLISK